MEYPKQPPIQPPKPKPGEGTEKKPEELGLWMVHDPAAFYDADSGYYYIYCTGAVCYRSRDLLRWENIGRVITEPPAESSEWVGGRDIWAPDIVKVGSEYRLYCSNSTWGVRQSCIFLAVSDNPGGPFLPRGCVLKTSDRLPVNAIDANIITDAATGEMYMIYGSFWGGCHALRLSCETGLADEEGVGVCLARRPAWQSTGIEGPYMIYNPDTEYYYLFVSYGSLKTDYNIRVGRSRSVTGPFLDHNGKSLAEAEDADNSIGLMLACGYRWLTGTPYMAPGHNSVLHAPDGSWYLVYHIRELNYSGRPEPSTLQIRRLYWLPDGWPVAAAQPYAGELAQNIPERELAGHYERISLAPSLPQGIMHAVPMKLDRSGYYECCSIQGTWSYDGKWLTIRYGPHCETACVSAAWDAENGVPTLMISGKGKDGVCFWAKKTGELR